MNKYEYLAELRNNLSSLPKSQQDIAVKHCREMINSAGRSKEQTVMKQLGSPAKLAHKILLSDDSMSSMLNETRRELRRKNGLNPQQKKKFALLAVLLFPIWGSLMIAVFGAVLFLFVGFISLFIVLAVLGIALICMGIVHIIESLSIGLVHIGIGLILTGAVLISFMPAMNFVFWIFKMVIKGISLLISTITGKPGVKS